MKKVSIILSLVCFLFLIVSCDNSEEEEEENNPTPVLSALSPTSAVANLSGFTLTLTGSNFVQGATVNFGGTAKSANFVSSTQLQCSISQTDIPGLALQDDHDFGSANLQDSAITVYVANPSPGGGNSNSLTFNVTNNYSFITQANISNDNYESASTKIALDTHNNISVVWDQERGGGVTKIMYTRSADHGATWPSQVDVSGANTESTWPDLAIGTSSDINVVWQQHMLTYDDIFFGRSTDSGATWSTPVNVSKSAYESSYPAVAIDASGIINVVWNDVVRFGVIAVFYKDTLFFARSQNGGAGFSTPLGLPDPLCKCRPAIAVDSAGRIFVAYRLGQCNAAGAIMVIFSEDGGVTWSSQKMVSESGQDADHPAFAIDSSGYINLVWQQTNQDYWDIYFSRSTDISWTWSTPVNISQTSGNSQHSSITVDSLKNLMVSWDEDVAGVEEIYQSRSVNNGVTWAGSVNISNNAGESTRPDIAVDSSCNLYFAWLDRTTGTTEIYFIRSVIAALTGK